MYPICEGFGKLSAMPERLNIRHPGEFYGDMLAIEAFLKGGRSLSEEACNLLCARLMQRREIRGEMLGHLAAKRKITVNALVDQILKGQAISLTPEEYKAMPSDEEPEAAP